MRTFALALTLTLVAGAPLMSAATAAPQEPGVELPSELQRVLDDYEVAWAARDADALAALFAPDGFVLSVGQPPIRGRDTIREHYTGHGGPLVLRAIAWAAEGDVAYIIGGYARAEGEPDSGKFTLTLRRQGDRWLIFSDMDSVNSRPQR